VTILRPPAVYGPGDTRMLPLFRAIKRGLMPRLGGGVTSMLYASDCVDAILLTLTQPHPVGRIYFLADGEIYDHARIGHAIAAAFGVDPLAVPVPARLLRAVGAAAEAYAKVSGRAVALTRDKVQDLLQPSWLVSAALARSELGFAPQVQLEAGAKVTADWYPPGRLDPLNGGRRAHPAPGAVPPWASRAATTSRPIGRRGPSRPRLGPGAPAPPSSTS
jgi:nucleoside-diphosphate-sugar epimerase